MFFGGTSTSQKCQVFLAPKNVSLEIQKLFSRQKIILFQFQIHRRNPFENCLENKGDTAIS